MKTKRWTIKQLSLLIAILLLATMTAGGSLAYIFTHTPGLTNTFEPTEVTCAVIEPGWTDGNMTKSGVTVKNTGDTTAYIRAAVVVTWQNELGYVLSTTPQAGETKDYTISFNATDWKLGSDGYYYHKTPVVEGGETKVLVNNCTVTGVAPETGYTLHVEIIADAVQAEPVDAVKEAWGVDPGAL